MKDLYNSRRNFLKTSSILPLGALIPDSKISSSSQPFTTKELPKGATILFQGDSITDSWRKRDHYYPNNGPGMGWGYVQIAASQLLAEYPNKNLKIYNRGISGNKVFELANRWQDDCLNLRPDLLSIMIGVNDFWHTLTHGYNGTIQTYKDDYRKLLDTTLEALPELQLIIIQPFVILEGNKIEASKWESAFRAYQEAAGQIAKEYKATYIALQSKFAKISLDVEGTYWAPDGVHPSPAGNFKIAQWWVSAFKAIYK